MLENSRERALKEVLHSYLNHSGTCPPIKEIEKTHMEFERFKKNHTEDDKLEDRELFRPKLINKN